MTARYTTAHIFPRPWRILLVQPDRSLRSCAGTALAARGCDVVEAASLAAAKHELVAADFDAVVTAMRLGDGDGFALVQIVRRAGRKAPVLVAKAFASSAAADQGGIWFARSPVPSVLLDMIYGASADSIERAQRQSAEPGWPVEASPAALTMRMPALRS